MAVDEELFWQASQYERAALRKYLAAVYPTVHRIAFAISGREDVGRGVVRFMMKQLAHRLPQWQDADSAERWLFHHTILTARRAYKHPPGPTEDVLTPKDSDPPCVAFVRALRALPMQQREAFLLHHGERFTMRQLGIAMDCSTRAAELHLKAATDSLRAIASQTFDAMNERLTKNYAALAPSDDMLWLSLNKLVQRTLWPKRIKQLIRDVLTLALMAWVAWMLWRLRGRLHWQ